MDDEKKKTKAEQKTPTAIAAPATDTPGATIDGGAGFGPVPPGSTVTAAGGDGAPLEAKPEEEKPVHVAYEPGDCAFLTTSIWKPDDTRVKAHTYVRVLGAFGGKYRVSLGRGLSSLVDGNELSRPPASALVTLTIGDVVEVVPEEKKATPA